MKTTRLPASWAMTRSREPPAERSTAFSCAASCAGRTAARHSASVSSRIDFPLRLTAAIALELFQPPAHDTVLGLEAHSLLEHRDRVVIFVLARERGGHRHERVHRLGIKLQVQRGERDGVVRFVARKLIGK